MLSALGGLGGLLLAEWGTAALIKAVPQNIPRIGDIRLDGAVLAFTLLVSLATGVIFGLVPAWQASHVDLNSSLKSGMRTGSDTGSKGRVRNGLVMAEVALAIILLISAGLLIQSFARLGQVQTGMRPGSSPDRANQPAGFGLSEERKHHRLLRRIFCPKCAPFPAWMRRARSCRCRSARVTW